MLSSRGCEGKCRCPPAQVSSSESRVHTTYLQKVPAQGSGGLGSLVPLWMQWAGVWNRGKRVFLAFSVYHHLHSCLCQRIANLRNHLISS